MGLDETKSVPNVARPDAPWRHDAKKDELKVIGKPIRKVDARSKVGIVVRVVEVVVAAASSAAHVD